MIGIKIENKESQFRLALAFAGLLREPGVKHGLRKHIRDNRKAWRKGMLTTHS